LMTQPGSKGKLDLVKSNFNWNNLRRSSPIDFADVVLSIKSL